jgi:predicted transcriptional regulator
MASAISELVTIREDLAAGRPVQSVTVRTFLSWFHAQRRGYWIVRYIKGQLREAGLKTEPDFESTWIDAPISFLVDEVAQERPTEAVVEVTPPQNPEVRPIEVGAADVTRWAAKDPTYRVSKLQAANQKIVSIDPDGTISQAVTLLMVNGISQLQFMTSEREVKGIITWRSIGSRMILNIPGQSVRDYMEQHHEIRHDTSIFDAIPIIVTNDYVLVRSSDNKISGIITASDLNTQFRNLTEPFLLLSEIENLIRNLIADRFSKPDLEVSRDPDATNRQIESVADLTFGEYIRLLQNQERWNKLGIEVDRKIFCEKLDRVREIRNDVTHFDPDGITSEELETLRDFATFLKRIEIILSLSQRAA